MTCQVGEDAGLGRSSRTPLFMSDIQHLLTYSMVGDRAPYWPHRWTTLSKWNRLSNVVSIRLLLQLVLLILMYSISCCSA